MSDGYSQDVLSDLTVNSWRPIRIATAIVAILILAIGAGWASAAMMVPVVVFGIYVAVSLWAAFGYTFFKRPDGGMPPARNNPLLAIVVLLMPRELLR